MKLSEAIREGAKAHPQTKGNYSVFSEDGECVGTCAIGAAYYGAFGEPLKTNMDELLTLRDATGVDVWCTMVEYPETSIAAGRRGMMQSAIVALNDCEDWTREQIADWLESIGC